MPDLTTRYMGLELRNPIIAGSSNLSESPEGVAELEKAGAGAVVLKSIFEEEITREHQAILRDEARRASPEALEYLDRQLRGEKLDSYRTLLAESKRRVAIPVIASVNCTYSHDWVAFAGEMQAAGADGLELNVFSMPTDFGRTAAEQEDAYFRTVERVLQEVSIPVALKISHYFTNLGPMIERLSKTGVAGLVLFNRFWSPDIDIEHLRVVPARILTTPEEIALPLRWVAIMSSRVSCDLAASTGIHDAEGAIKMLLAGAQAVQVVSALYRNGVEHLGTMVSGLERWMEAHDYMAVGQFRGRMSQAASAHPDVYERAQYMRYFGPALEGGGKDHGPGRGLDGFAG
jgi:dihydroorotate dehydrogenase (fumarate)